MNIAVLSGGLSPERDVSLSSGVMISNALKKQGHKVAFLDLFFGLETVPENPLVLFDNDNEIPPYSVKEQEPDLDKIKKSRKSGFSPYIGNGVIEVCRAADITYLALHGGDGENGRLQAFFDLNGIRYTGSSSFGCTLAMDKWITKQMLLGSHILTPSGILVQKDSPIPAYENPCVIKPCSGGSSIGISIAHNKEEYKKAIDLAFEQEDIIVIEEYIQGTELTCGILGDIELPPTEIIPNEGFYDYAHKYQKGWTEEITPARISKELTKKVQCLSRKVFRTLHLSVYGRIDFILTANNEIYCIEANTLPGMTPTSLLPQGAAEIGIAYPVLCDKIVSLSLEKY